MISSNNYSYYNSPEIQERISQKLANLFTPTSRIDKLLLSVIKEFMDKYVVPYFTDVITRYTQDEFHQRIAEGFDIVEDMRNNHPHLFWGFIKVTRKFRNRLVFNENVLFDTIMDIVEGYPYYWAIRSDERAKIFDMVHRLKMEIYS